jgi:voltage-gated potassium channel
MQSEDQGRTVQETPRRCAVADEPGSGRPSAGAIVGTLLHSAAASIVLLAVYYQAPLDRPLSWATGWLFGMALLLFAVIMAFQLRGILRSQQPRLRAVRALGLALPLLPVIFASAYCTIAAQQPGAFSEPLGRTDGIYFTVTVFSTVGLGDISPVTELARVLVTIQMLVGLVVIGLIAKLVVGAVDLATARRKGPERVDGERADLH